MKKLMNYKSMFLDVIGFDSLGDFLSNVFSSGTYTKAVYILSFCVGGVLKLVDKFILSDVYSSATGIRILFFVSLGDVLLGLSKAIRDKKFEASRLSRALVRFVVQVFIVGLLYNMNRVWPWAIFTWMVDVLLISFVLSTMWSMLKNAKTLGWIQEDTYLMLERLLSIDEILKRAMNKKKDETNVDP